MMASAIASTSSAGMSEKSGSCGSGSDVGSCASPRTLTLTTSGATTLTGDTTGAPSTLTMEDCGGGEPAPQDVIAVTIPGDSGDIYGVRFDFAQDGTPEAFDTVVQIRETCGSETDAVLVN